MNAMIMFSGGARNSPLTAIYRRRWGCETALQGARLRLSRAYLAAGGDARHARGVARPTFDPGDADHFAAAASPVLRGTAVCLPGSATRRLCIFRLPLAAL